MTDVKKTLNIALCAAGEIYGGVEEWVFTFIDYVNEARGKEQGARLENRSEKLEVRSDGEALSSDADQRLTTHDDVLDPGPQTLDPSINVTVILFHDGPLAAKLRESGVDVGVIAAGKYSVEAIRQLKTVLKARQIDVVHTHGYKATITCAIAAKQCKIPVVKTEHSIVEPTVRFTLEEARKVSLLKILCSTFCILPSNALPVRMHINTFLDRLITRWCVDYVTYVSDFARQKIHPFYGKKPFAVIHNGIPLRSGVSDRPPEFRHDRFNVGIVGRLSAVKGHRFLLEAVHRLQGQGARSKGQEGFENLDPIHLHIFGAGSLESDLKQRCADLGIANQVTFHGFKNNVQAYVAHLDLLVMPSVFESLPYTLLEAMYYAVPIVASHVGGIPEIIENGRDGVLVPSENAEALSEAIQAVVNDPVAASDRAECAHQKVLTQFSIQKMIDAYVACYCTLVKSE